MESADVIGSSTTPLTWHDFLERMRQPSASEFVKAIKSFIVSFLNNSREPERDSAAVQQFLSKMEAAFRSHPLWAGCSEEELESAGEGLEKYIMTKLFPRVFASLPDDVRTDDQLHEKMALIQQFIRPENLDIKPTFQNEASWLLAQKELQKINMFKAPRDKIICILNCCKVINNLLLNATSDEDPPGADDFLPVLIYIIIKANPPQLHSNLLYIQRYRHQTRLVGETSYFFTNVLSAESFILNIDAKAISLDETEFEQNMESARALLFGLSGEGTVQGHQDGGNLAETDMRKSTSPESSGAESRSDELHIRGRESLGKIPSASDLESKGATTIMKHEDINQVFQEFPYFFSRAGDLTISDVEDLLCNYKQLVFRYICLSKGLGIPNPSPPRSERPGESQHSSQTVEVSEAIKTEDEINETLADATNDLNGLLAPVVEESEFKLESQEVPTRDEGGEATQSYSQHENLGI
ncbi:guanyl-nucleotide exchange factor [Lithospermum erythrorhizon]|uniref:Guanyl-nucleotide exchange factor n=1 Tax=Lithospermum erythrorhizon TaxID=34254 RepID=A0AAV3Q5T3_LITER